MVMSRLKETFSGPATKIGASLLAVFALSGNANADGDTQPVSFNNLGHCDQYEVNGRGQQMGAFGSAVQYSQHKDNDVAVIVYTGGGAITPDKALLGAEKMASIIRQDGMRAQCFVGGHDPSKGTSYLFMVNGQLVPESKGLDIREAVGQLDAVKSEARVVRAAGIKGNQEYLLSSSSPAFGSE